MVKYVSTKNIYQYISTTLGGCKKSIDFLIKSKEFNVFTLHLPDNAGLMRGLKVNNNYADLFERCLEQKKKDGLAHTLHVLTHGDDYHPIIKDIIVKASKDPAFKSSSFSLRKNMYTRPGSLDRNKLISLGMKVKEYQSTSNQGKYFCRKRKMNSPVLLLDGSLNICSLDYGFRMTYGNLFKEKLSEIRKQWILQHSESFSNEKLSPYTECEHYIAD